MGHIELKCKTRGFKFGAIVEVGNAKGQVPKEEAEGLVTDGMAKVYNKPVTASTAVLKGEVTKFTNANKALDDKIVTLEANKAGLEKKLLEDSEKLEALELKTLEDADKIEALEAKVLELTPKSK